MTEKKNLFFNLKFMNYFSKTFAFAAGFSMSYLKESFKVWRWRTSK